MTSEETPPTEKALRFDGRSSYVMAPSLVPDPRSPVTLEAIFRMRNVRTSNVISWLGPDWTALFVSDRGSFGIGRLVQGQSVLIQTRRAWDAGQRVHLAGVWDGRELSLFVNGESTATDGVGFTLPETAGGLFIGGVDPSRLPEDQRDRFFDGLIYEVRITEGVRYSGPFDAPETLDADATTLALYRFDAGSGDDVQDESGHGHEATIVNAEWVER